MTKGKYTIPYLQNPQNSHAREAILKHKFIFDLSVSAAKRNYYLTNYESDIDNEGVDIVITDNELMRPIQLKSIYNDAKATKWKLHKRLLRPTFYEIESLGFSPETTSEGVGGAFILQCIDDSSGNVEVSYMYVDIFTLIAFHQKVIKKAKNSPKQETIDNFMSNLFSGKRSDRIEIPKSLLLTAKTPDHLLSLLSLHSPVTPGGGLNHFIHSFTKQKFETKTNEQQMMVRAIKQQIFEEMEKCTKEDLELIK